MYCKTVVNTDFPTINASFAPGESRVDVNAARETRRDTGKSRVATQENVRSDALPAAQHDNARVPTTRCQSAELPPHRGRVAGDMARSNGRRAITKCRLAHEAAHEFPLRS